ncbi:methyltransferase domain-containing protein [Colletotrichum scovillei]|uniref:Methyltransferase domain-containing protein n=1 Tax=Colletotrichum scovillei TaxID=1209932 RepID=A0A9P7U967_9PEZI|nr:methyltransferase domain-containing protein [Colletotrichum scovillei]KAG7059549.1 methyltransferase domain-containing protein [Colletotrichum scovillei]KAG7066995.1 methyltransferase domain-containing protein [Colletotrichum scovillei]
MSRRSLQMNRMEPFQHHQFLLSFDGKLGLSPPDKDDYPAKSVLDVGTGTRTWAIKFGELNPEAESRVPPNVIFEVDDIEEPWTFSLPFDYIHSRMMTSSISNWRRLIQNAFEFVSYSFAFSFRNPFKTSDQNQSDLTLSGYLALQKMDLMPQSDDDQRYDCAAATELNRSFQDILDLVNVMKEIGFVDVSIKEVKWPTNTWPKEQHYKLIGQWAHENCMSGSRTDRRE